MDIENQVYYFVTKQYIRRIYQTLTNVVIILNYMIEDLMMGNLQ